jgi:hypothetical protein
MSFRYRLIIAAATFAAVPAFAAEMRPGWRDPVSKKVVCGAPATRAEWPSLAALFR